MAVRTTRFERWSTILILVGLILLCSSSNPLPLSAQSQRAQTNPPIIRSTESQFSTVVLGPISPSPSPLEPRVGRSGSGLTIIPTFDSSIDAASQTIINNAITFYESTFTTNITVHIFFFNMSSGLGESISVVYTVPYGTGNGTYCSALTSSATSADDATALAHTPCGTNNPVTNNSNIDVKPPNGLAIGLGTPEVPVSFGGTNCTNFTGACIGLNLSLANSHNILLATVEHEIDEVLGLGSALSGTTTPADPATEDLFRWASAGTRSFATNSSTTNPCAGGTPSAFFSIDGGNTNLDNFNNCNNTGDYGDWIEHTTTPQVQDAFINVSGTPPSLNISSPEVRALDVIGYTLASSSKHRRGQLISQ